MLLAEKKKPEDTVVEQTVYRGGGRSSTRAPGMGLKSTEMDYTPERVVYFLLFPYVHNPQLDVCMSLFWFPTELSLRRFVHFQRNDD